MALASVLHELLLLVVHPGLSFVEARWSCSFKILECGVSVTCLFMCAFCMFASGLFGFSSTFYSLLNAMACNSLGLLYGKGTVNAA